MASFVEQATLLVKDKSTAQIKRINAALKQLNTTARSLKNVRINLTANDSQIKRATQSLKALRRELNAVKSTRINFNASTGGLRTAQAQVKNLTRDIKNLKAASASMRAVKMNVNSQGLQTAHQRLTRLQHQAQQGIKVPPIPPPIPGTRPRRTPGTRTGARGSGSNVFGAAARGAKSGFGSVLAGMPVFGLNPAMLAVTTAAYAAAAALTAVSESGAKRDRSMLQTAIAATPEQRTIIEESVRDAAKNRGSLPMTIDQRRELVTSLLGDVPGAGTTEGARQAIKIADMLERDVLPRQFALAGPDADVDEVHKQLRQLVKAVNLATPNLLNEKGEISGRGEQVLRGIQMAMAADPELTPRTIRTAMANMKTAALTLSDEALAKVLINVGNRGMRASNEQFQMMQSVGGTVDNKGLLEGLAKMGLLTGFTRETKGKKSIKMGTGKIKDEFLLQEDPFAYVQAYIVPELNKYLDSKESKERQAAAKAKGLTDDEIKTIETKGFVTKAFPGMRQTAGQNLFDLITGDPQFQATIRQARASMSQPVDPAMQKSVTAQYKNLITALENRKAAIGEDMFKALGLAENLKLLTEAVKNPGGDEAKTLAGKGVKGILAMLDPRNQFEFAVTALTKAGGLMITAAESIISWITGKKPDSEKTPAERATDSAAAAAKAKRDQQLFVFEKGESILQDIEREITSARQRMKMGNAASRKQAEGELKDRTAEYNNAVSIITALGVALGKIKLPEWLTTDPKNFPKPPATTPDGKPVWGDTKPSSAADIKEAASTMDTSASHWATTVTAVPGKFNDAFNTLPQKGTDGGNNFGSGAIKPITEGAPGAGRSFGNEAMAVIRAGVASLPAINVKATVTGGGDGTDKGNGGKGD